MFGLISTLFFQRVDSINMVRPFLGGGVDALFGGLIGIELEAYWFKIEIESDQ